MRRLNLLDIAWLLLLGVYVMAGIPLATFHGDETNQLYGTRDFRTVFVEGRPQDLIVAAPNSDGAAYLRIVHGSVGRYSMGLALYAAGLLNEETLPPSGYRWGRSYDDNIAGGTRPSGALLWTGRFFPALYTAVSVGVMFALGWLFGGRPLARFVSLLYAVNPIILLNGRRALQEGPLLLFGLLAVLVAAHISRKRAAGERVSWRWWLSLIVTSALVLASKNTGFIFIGAAFGWIAIAELTHFQWREAARVGLILAACGVLAVALFWAISPGMWHHDPIERINHVLEIRREQMTSQVSGIQGGAAPISQRVEAIITQPYMSAPAHFELNSWNRIPAMRAEVEQYMASPLSGVQFGALLGGLLTLLAAFGIVVAFVPRLRPPVPFAFYAGLLIWGGVNVIVLLLNPLVWQRYIVPFIPAVTMLTGIGAWGVVSATRRGLRNQGLRTED